MEYSIRVVSALKPHCPVICESDTFGILGVFQGLPGSLGCDASFCRVEFDLSVDFRSNRKAAPSFRLLTSYWRRAWRVLICPLPALDAVFLFLVIFTVQFLLIVFLLLSFLSLIFVPSLSFPFFPFCLFPLISEAKA
jgi:hypothetical protein